ncbi:DUF456 domain-containing protein [Streptomyces sp. NBC_01525]|uniref:DUF456 domain-containing protein n=1 Tax=Streptomyces benahoarensis TaxID=2595054 RepID=A0A553YTH1_9ACTN|nr:DUF456 domain-containing protein [Streptomyces benahoarensis]TSB15179.1 DUF456 domain-containing protein [Streptomyces benahoarensis]TSB32521.1 DUF456 domain-containing protein [Streptomyces benahoarensis]
MSGWQLFAVGLVLLLGLFGVLVPGVPGTPIVWAGVLWWAMTEQTSVAWTVLIAATALLLLQQAVKFLLPTRNLRAAGTPYRVLFLSGAAGIAGFFVIPVIGAPLCALGAHYLLERVRLGSHGDAWAATRTAMRAVGLSVLVELFACLLVVGAWAGVVFAG